MICRALGGLNERGNHCFLLDDPETPILLDCGLGGPRNRNPRITEDIAERAALLLISHSHLDHIGSIPFLLKRGFKGKIVTTRTTYLTSGSPKDWDCLFIEPDKPLRFEGATITAHRAGHCLGSVWFDIELGGRRIVYSGDYMEGGSYAFTPIRGMRADLAILDGSYYGKKVAGIEESIERISDIIRENGGRVYLPAPRNGRGLALYALARSLGYSARIEGKGLLTTDAALWLKDAPGKITSDPDGETVLLTDKDFERKETVDLVMSDTSRAIIFTGNLDPDSTAEHIYRDRKNTYLCFYNAHETQEEIDRVLASNTFGRVWIFSSERTDYPSMELEF